MASNGFEWYQIISNGLGYSDTFGYSRILLDTLGYSWILSNTLGHSKKLSDSLGHSLTLSHIYIYWTHLGLHRTHLEPCWYWPLGGVWEPYWARFGV